jgi:demethylspheroidene O-methyltransferase
MGSGRPRRREEVEALLRQAGFGDIRFKATRQPLLTSLLIARPRAYDYGHVKQY